uniref:Uncharacterized protein n=1 Tax=Ficus carica TaxID=3494 RepID=A0AA87Z8W4_FICCA|nr:hypothetical protein TIFTF001_050528 [Ficus carica]GMN28354.1 hypothetical protein TIFTF001_050533 [Ficus carica]
MEGGGVEGDDVVGGQAKEIVGLRPLLLLNNSRLFVLYDSTVAGSSLCP